MSKHTAPANVKTSIIEATFSTLFNKNTPNRDGKYRAGTVSNALKGAA
jgi:hypothetical protein